MYIGQPFGTFTVDSATATAGTAFAKLIPPWRGGNPPLRYKVENGVPNWTKRGAFTHLTKLIFAAGSTAHNVVVMRPLNWAVISADVAANSSTIVLAADPGTYATTYRYGLGPDAGGVVANIANNGIAGSDYVAYQLRDGTWVLDTVSSVSSLTLTMTTATPNVTGGGIEAGSILFFFGVAANVDPATGVVSPTLTSTASTRVDLLNVAGSCLGDVPSLHPGDPMMIYCANASNASTLISAAGYYSDR